MPRIPRFMSRIGVAMLFLLFYFIIIAPLLPYLVDSALAWLDSYRHLFSYNATMYKYVYTNNTIYTVTEAATVDYYPLLALILRLVVVFLPLLVVLAILLGRW